MRHLIAALLCSCTLPAQATEIVEPAEKARAYIAAAVEGWAADPSLIEAVRAQNLRHKMMTQEDIDTLDRQWMQELGRSQSPLISSVVDTAASDLLRDQIELSAGLITEVFVMDAVGLNVAASGITSDYWQGDEAKFTETYQKGKDGLHISDVEFDESAHLYQIQASFSLLDPEDGTLIGAITVGLNAEQL